MLKQSEILDLFKKTGALLEGHFLLTSGLHSPNYFQCARVLQFPKYMTLLCTDIAGKIRGWSPDVLVGPAMGGVVPAQEVGRILDVRTIFAERENNEMTLRRGFEINKGEKVVIIEDVLTTGKSINEVRAVISRCGGEFAGAAVIVDRGGIPAKPDSPPTISLLSLQIETFSQDNCPLCTKGLPVVKPGSRKI